jgi:hypothetical protein
VFAYADAKPLIESDPFGLSGTTSRKDRCTKAISELRGILGHAVHHHDPAHPQSAFDICRQLDHWKPKFDKDNCDVYDKTLRKVVEDYQNDFCNGCSQKQKAPDPSWQQRLQRWLNGAKKNLPPFFFLPPIFTAPPEPVVPGLPPFFINPCMLRPALCYGPGGTA